MYGVEYRINSLIQRYRNHARRLTSLWLGTIFLFALGLAACNSSRPLATTPVAVQNSTVTPTPLQITPTAEPSPTPQPRAILWAPPGADPSQVAGLESLMPELTDGSGLAFEVVQSLSAADLSPDVKAVVVLSPDPGVAALAGAAAQTEFLAVDIPGLQPAANLIPVSAQALPDQQGFLAGYLASLVTQDWRVGVISPADSPSGKANRQGFLNGVIFYCGLCRPAYPPFVQYPVFVDLATGASSAEQQAAADTLIAQGVTTVYVAPGAGDFGLLEYLAQQGVNLIGASTPPVSVAERWIATISADLEAALRQAWEQALGRPASGDPQPGALAPSLAITDRNEALFSIGRQRLAEQMQLELASGLVDTGVDPATGEAIK